MPELPELIVITDDSTFFRDLLGAHIPDLTIEKRPFIFASVDPPSLEQLLLGQLVITLASGAALTLLGVWIQNRIEKGNRHKIAVDGQEVTENPKQVPIIINNYIQQNQININPKPDEKEQP